MVIGETLQHYRKLNRLSQKDLETILRITRQSISKWENNKCLPDIDNLILLAIIYDCTVDDLIVNRKNKLILIL